ncbi:hypothetical protein GCM10009830_30150 [Glycomyces endophyticus]|uniref:YbaB/EbfC family DNA-binding protein n=1 Tax=Glycomyces endophyticus TaxID=480996 RepID=A0ABP4T1Z7_9ACTN
MDQTPAIRPPSSDPVPPLNFDASMRDFRARMEALGAMAEKVEGLVRSTSFRVESERGEVAVTVTFGGRLVGVEFLPAADGMGAEALAAVVFDTHERAVRTAFERAAGNLVQILDPRIPTEELLRRLA